MKQNILLSMCINVIRKKLLKKDFFEHHLYSSVPYKIEKTDSFRLKEGLFLRVNPEPDIWEVGTGYDYFFWIGSMFRKEKKPSPIHQYEFTVADIYLSNGSMNDVVTLFLEIMTSLEKEFNFKQYSKSPVRYISHSGFQNTQFQTTKEPYWLVVTDYPNNESFFDQKVTKTNTAKFEIFFVKNGIPVEIAACGVLGDNKNEEQFIRGRKNTISKKLKKKNFIGFAFGIERVLYIYHHIA